MNKILKIAAVFVLGIGVLTGCTDKVAQNITFILQNNFIFVSVFFAIAF